MILSQSSTTRLLRIVLLFTAMFSAMGGPALAPALPSIKASFHSIPDIEFWTKALVAISGLFSALGAILFGWFSDRYGRKPALITALSIWSLAGTSGMIPQPFWALMAGRAFLGLGLGGLLVSNTAMIADSYSRDQQRHMMGLQSAFASSGIVLSLIISGWLADIHWRWVFSIFLLGVMILPGAFFVPEPELRDPLGDQKVSPEWGSMAVLSFFAFSAMVSFNVIPTQLPFFMLHSGLIDTAVGTGLILAIMPVASAIAGRTYIRISKTMNLWNIFIVAGLFMITGFSIISFATGMAGLVVGLSLIGSGFGISMPNLNIVLTRIVPAPARGRAMGILIGVKFMGLFMSPFVFQPVLAHMGYHVMLRTAGGFMLFAALIIWTLKFKHKKDNNQGVVS